MQGWTRGAAAVAVAFVAACASKDDDKTVAGRTASASVAPSTTLVATLRRTRVIEAATGLTAARLEARVEAPDARAVALRTPTNEELPLEALDGAFVLEVEGDEALLASRFPRGGYTWVLDLPAGRDATATVLLRDPPAPPTLLAPTDLAVVPVDALVVRWAGDAERHDVRLVEVASGDEVHVARDLTERRHVVPAGVLEAGRRYRVEVLGVDGPWGAPARAASGVAVLVDGAP